MKLADSLLRVLEMAPGPQSSADLHDAVRRGGLAVEQYEVVEELRCLQREGVVRFEGTRWRLLKTVPGAAGPSEEGRAGGSVWPVQKSAPSSSAPAPIPTPAGRWAQFRALCNYYGDCLLQEEAPQLRSFVENQDDTWISLPNVPWAWLAEGRELAVPLDREQAAFQRNRARRGEEECVYLCYPVKLVKTKDDARFLVPLFAQPMRADWDSGVLRLKSDGDITVNGAWLDFEFRKRTEQSAFLREMGLLTEIDLEGDADEPLKPRRLDFAKLAENAARYIHDTERFAEPIMPMLLGPAHDLKRAKPGLYNTAILTLGPGLRYTRSLLRELRAIARNFSDEQLDQTALSYLFPHEPPPPAVPSPSPLGTTPSSPVAFPTEHLAQTRLLHTNQRKAVLNAMAESVSVVTGPPGTGKSEVVTGMLLNQLLRGRATLFASKNHQALEAVLPRMNQAVEEGALIVQTSSRDLAQRENYLGKLQSLLAQPPRADAAQGVEHRRKFTELFDEERAVLAEMAALAKVRDQYETLQAELAGLRHALPETAQSDEGLLRWPSEVTIERLEALAVELRATLVQPVGLLAKFSQWFRRRQIEVRRQAVLTQVMALPSAFVNRSLPDASKPAGEWDGWFAAWKSWASAAGVAARLRLCEQAILQMPPVELVQRRLAAVQQAIEDRTREWMRWAAGGLPAVLAPADREALANLRAGIQTWGAGRFKKALQERFPLILRAFPLWSVSNLSARSALPLVPGLFDLVIIDEASQCDIASVVPLLARSRRVVFAGDPMQLQHVSRLDPVVEQTLLEQHGLTGNEVQRFSYRVNSAFTLADASADVPDSARVRLDLHFRSHEQIADYCSEAFYSKSLHVVTLTERLNIPLGMKPGVHWTDVVGKPEPASSGVWCAEEIEAVRAELARLEAEGYRGTIGVVTPFRVQMTRLKDALEDGAALPREFLERVRFLVATAHGFQGDERDLILFSLCAGPGMPDGSMLFLRENPNLFNVAVSRARAVLHVVGNRDWALNSRVHFIEKLARRSLASHSPAVRQSDPYQSPWEKVLADALREAGIEPVPQYPIAGRFLDLAILGPRKIDVEVDGESVHRTARGGRRDDDHWRDLQLQSLGWRVCRFWVYELRENLPRCVQRVAELMKA